MNAFLNILKEYEIEKDILRRGQLTTLQVNVGNLCNQSCRHCHIEASPLGREIMSRKVVDDSIGFLSRYKISTLDITGGAPELNPNFDYLIILSRPLVDEIMVRSNLTVFFEKGKDYLPDFFKAHKVHLICSLPCYTKENVDQQRGKGVFEKSIKALRLLNSIGFSRKEELCLDLVYNPLGGYLPAPEKELSEDYKKRLKEDYGVEFNRLLTITNVAIKRFKVYLESNQECERYSKVLRDNFNPQTLKNLMCHTFLSVGFDGRLYDCDFNLALGYALKDADGRDLTIERLNPEHLENREIITGEHCLACTAGSGSSCQGSLTHSAVPSHVSQDGDKQRRLSVNPEPVRLRQGLSPELSRGTEQAPDFRQGYVEGLTNENIYLSPAVQEDKKELVRAYYGKVLKDKKDLKTSACCSTEDFPEPIRSIVKNIEPEILDKFYGCGSPLPELLGGCTVLDLGCGSGRDVYIASALVGESGLVIGVDMTDEQLEVARRYKDIQMKRFGFKSCNVDFKQGYIEDLKEIGIADNSIDMVISNCVINLSADKRGVFSEIFRVLKSGGELYFSDIFAGRRIPEQLKNDPLLYGECLGGALYIEDFRRLLQELRVLDYRVVSKRRIELNDPALVQKVGMIDFYSLTVRAFKLDDLEDICEDYGQVAYYQGTIAYCPHEFRLDDHHIFVRGKPMLVCGNTASMLTNTRFAKHFRIIGTRITHYGPFNCAAGEGKVKGSDSVSTGGCCG